MRRRLKWLAGGATALALTLGAGPALAGLSVVRTAGPLSDLSSAPNPTDGAHGRLVAVAPGNGTTYLVFVVTGLDPEAAGTILGAHVHVGPCVAGNGGVE